MGVRSNAPVSGLIQAAWKSPPATFPLQAVTHGPSALVPERWGLLSGTNMVPTSLYLTEMRRHMDFSTPPDYRAQTAQARAGVTDHSDRYILLFGLSGVIVAFTMVLMDFAN
jgi:hypothetical protein